MTSKILNTTRRSECGVELASDRLGSSAQEIGWNSADRMHTFEEELANEPVWCVGVASTSALSALDLIRLEEDVNIEKLPFT